MEFVTHGDCFDSAEIIDLCLLIIRFPESESDGAVKVLLGVMEVFGQGF